MATYQNSDILSNLTLGKATKYCSHYSPELLQAVPRSLNRADLLLEENSPLPFKGEDLWYGYELSWLNLKGKPIVAVAQFSFPCTSPNLVESKSFKLYLNSFNQTKFSSFDQVKTRLIKDLSHISGAEVQVSLFNVNNCPALEISKDSALCIDDLDITIDNYQYSNTILSTAQSPFNKNANNDIVEECLVSHLLKSNCLITNQPDWASLYISYKGRSINHESLLKYIISFRQHNEFHEQCVERIFCDLMQNCQLESLTIFARYTRRGGLDINPFRSTESVFPPKQRTLRQ